MKRNGMSLLFSLLILILTVGGFAFIGAKRSAAEGKRNVPAPEAESLLSSLADEDVSEVIARRKEKEESLTAAEEETLNSEDEELYETAESKEDELISLKESLIKELDQGEVSDFSDEELSGIRKNFDGMLFIGDSMAQAIGSFDLIDFSQIIYVRGGTIDVLSEKIPEAAALYPEKIVVFTGLNDCSRYYYDPEEYIEDDTAFLTGLSDIAGAENVYVCSLLPPSDWLAAQRPDLAASGEYDERLKTVCESVGVTYVDTLWMVREDNHADDGIHYTYDFYVVWLRWLDAVISGQEG